MLETLLKFAFFSFIAYVFYSSKKSSEENNSRKKDAPKGILPYLPELTEAVVEREFYFDKYFGMLLSEVECNGPMNYQYIFLIFMDQKDGGFIPTPIKCYAAEWSVGGTPEIYLGSFVEELQKPYDTYHINYGSNKEFIKLDTFFNTCMSMAIDELNLDPKLKYKINKKVLNEENIRTIKDILNEYNISEEKFQRKYNSYKKTFDVMVEDHDRTGFIGMFDHDFYFDFQTLTDDERKKALFSMNQRIINRVITSLDSKNA